MKKDRKSNRLQFAACAVAMAASVSGALASPAESQALDSIERYCAASWRTAGINRQDWPDCTQQVFIELLERLSRDQVPTAIADAQSEERRELNRSIWCIAQRWRRAPRLYSLDPRGPAEPAAQSDRPVSEWDEVAEAAAECLTDQQRRIVGLYAQGWSINEIATELNLSAARASDEKYKAVQKLRRTLGKVGQA